MTSENLLSAPTPRRRRVLQCLYQLSSSLARDRFPNPGDRFREARRLCLAWMQRRLSKELGYKLSQDAWEGRSFEIDRDGQFFGAASVDSLDLWTSRLEHGDERVPTRTWMVDLALRRVGEDVIFLIRMLCSTAYSVNSIATPSVPRIVRDLAGEIGLIETRRLSGEPWVLSSASDLDELELLICSGDRRLPVVMLTETNPDKRSYRVSRFVLDERKLASDLLGLAYIVVMPDGLGRDWTKRVGRQWSAFDGAVRTYYPGADFTNGVPFRHPLALVEHIVLYEYNGLLTPEPVRGEVGFSMLLKERSFGSVAARPFKHEEALFYRFAKLQNLAQAASARDDRELLNMQVEELSEQLEDARDDARDAWELAGSVEAELQTAHQEVRNLRSHVEFLRSKLTQKPEEVIPIPDTLEVSVT